jgi:circadian clock protein KaiB
MTAPDHGSGGNNGGILMQDDNRKFVLFLYITGNTPRSARSVLNIRSFCQRFLHGRCDLQIVDLYQQPELARNEQILASPTLIKKFPLPLRRVVGDFSDHRRVLQGLQLAAENG